jgi:hypothetical protein
MSICITIIQIKVLYYWNLGRAKYTFSQPIDYINSTSSSPHLIRISQNLLQ